MTSRPRRKRYRSLRRIDTQWNILSARTVVVGLLLLVVWVGVAVGREWSRRTRVESEIWQLEQEISHVEQSRQDIQKLLEAFSSPAMVEQEARRRLNVAHPDETVVVLSDDAPINQQSEPDTYPFVDDIVRTQTGTGPVANVLAWWRYFFNR